MAEILLTDSASNLCSWYNKFMMAFRPEKKCVANACRQRTDPSAFGDSLPDVLNQSLRTFGHNECAKEQTITWHILHLFRHAVACITDWDISHFWWFFGWSPILAQHLLYIYIGSSAFEGSRICTNWGLWKFSRWFSEPSGIIFWERPSVYEQTVQGRPSNNMDFWKRHGHKSSCFATTQSHRS